MARRISSVFFVYMCSFSHQKGVGMVNETYLEFLKVRRKMIVLLERQFCSKMILLQRPFLRSP